jgi:hypothetical protein
LNSAAGVLLPGPNAAPPMKTISRTLAASRGSLTMASAILVIGPIGHNVMSPGLAITVSMMKSTAWPSASGTASGSRNTLPSPPSP